MSDEEVPVTEMERWMKLYRDIGGMTQAITDMRGDIEIIFQKEEKCQREVDERLKALESAKNQAKGLTFITAVVAFVMGLVAMFKAFFR